MTPGRGSRLVADLGGTNARFALAVPGERPGEPVRLAVAEHGEFGLALEAALAALGTEPGAISEAAMAAAGPVREGRVQLTNAPWTIEAEAVSAQLGGAPVRLANDLEAVALALPHLEGGDLAPLRPGRAEAHAPRLALNVGTGFGGALAVPCSGGWTAVAAEPGHMVFTAATEAERALQAFAGTMEDVLSGKGIAALEARLSGQAAPRTGAEVLSGAAAGETFARATAELAVGLLARVAADLALATGAWGGVALVGSVADALARETPDLLAEALDTHFARPNPVAGRLSAVPVERIAAPDPALIGLAALPPAFG